MKKLLFALLVFASCTTTTNELTPKEKDELRLTQNA